jgi:DNA-binding NarL/FixJ family response regulator
VSKIRVLLADDNKRMLNHVREFLSTNGCDVVGEVTDGEAAVEAALKFLPDVVVMDFPCLS